eukprot:gene31381-40769_t
MLVPFIHHRYSSRITLTVITFLLKTAVNIALSSVTLPTSLWTIDYQAFRFCQSLQSIYRIRVNFFRSVTSLGAFVFAVCTSLSSMSLPTSIVFIPNYFCESCSLRSLVVPTSVTYIGVNAFALNSVLANVTLPTSLLVIDEQAFGWFCSKLQSLVIPTSVTVIAGYAFRYGGLTKVTVPSSVVSVGDYVFSSCTALTSMSLPTSLTYIPNYFCQSCTSLQSLVVPTLVTSIGIGAFQCKQGC